MKYTSIIYSGFRNEIDHPGYTQGVILPEFCKHLTWPEPHKMPEPRVEISREEWMQLGILGIYGISAAFYDGLNIPGEPEWFGGWKCHVNVYPEYTLIDAHMNFSPHSTRPLVGRGEIIVHNNYTAYTIRYFKIGCQHAWRAVPEESRMCYHVSVCTKCDQKQAIDSSD